MLLLPWVNFSCICWNNNFFSFQVIRAGIMNKAIFLILAVGFSLFKGWNITSNPIISLCPQLRPPVAFYTLHGSYIKRTLFRQVIYLDLEFWFIDIFPCVASREKLLCLLEHLAAALGFFILWSKDLAWCGQILIKIIGIKRAHDFDVYDSFLLDATQKTTPPPSGEVSIEVLSLIATDTKFYLHMGLSRALFWIYFPFFSWYIVRLQLIIFTMVNDDGKQERRRKSMHRSITCNKKKPNTQWE